MTIKVYPSHVPGEPIETHEFAGGTFVDWLRSKEIDHTSKDVQPITVTVGDRVLTQTEWSTVLLSQNDIVHVRFRQFGDPITWAVVAAIALGAAMAFMPKPRVRAGSDSPQGTRLDATTVKANQPRMGEVVPELAGRFRRYPDYLTPPRRRFVGLREQWLEFLACVGPGSYQINWGDVRVGDTPILGLGSDASFQIYEPNADISANSAHQHWHTVTEVGGTSNGTAGLDLNSTPQYAINNPASSYLFSGPNISIPGGDQSFPPGWGPGTVVTVNANRPLNHLVSFVSARNRFAASFAHLMPLANGTPVMVSGAGLSGEYIAQSVSIDGNGDGSIELWVPEVPPFESDPGTPSVPVDWIAPGDYTITIRREFTYALGFAAPDRLTVAGHIFPTFECAADIVFVGGDVYGEFTALIGATPGTETTTTLEFDFFFPKGLALVTGDSLGTRSVTIEIQYRDRDAGGVFSSLTRTYTEATLDQIGYTEQLAITSMRPEVRVRRVGVVSSSQSIQDEIVWYGLKSQLPIITRYPNWTTIAVQFRSGGRLAAQSENQINLVATRRLPTLQPGGTWSAPVATRDTSAFARYIAHSIGYTDANIDMEELERLHDIWVARGETLDFIFEETTVKEALDTAFGAGMSELTIDDGLIKPVRDDVRTQFEQGYSPQNMLGALKRSFRSRRIDDHDGVEVEYIDGQTWAKEVVRCLLPGDAGFKVLKIKLDGVTDRTRAWRIGMRQRRVLRYRNREYQFETELDAMNSGYLSYVPLIDDIPGYGQSAILHAIASATGGALLQVSEPLMWIEGETHVVAYRKPDGTIAGPFLAIPGSDDYSLIADIPAPWPVVTLSHEPPHVYFGTTTRWAFPALITEITPDGFERVSVSADNYDGRVYLDDNNAPA